MVPGVVRPLPHRSDSSPVSSYRFQAPQDVPKVNKWGDSFSDEDDDPEFDVYAEEIKRGKMEIEPSILDPCDEGTPDHWIRRNPTMIRLTENHPFNSEPPLTRLMHHGFITPVPLHYVRNHGPVPKSSWENWTVEITGLVKRPTRFTMDQLVSEFKSVEFPVTLVCAGNRQKEMNMVKETTGCNWGAAGISTSVWRGVRLRHVLKRCGIFSRKEGALHVCFEGAEDISGGGGSKYGTSILKEVAMDPSRDIILAYLQNGDKLSPDHGYPVRMIIPGFIGGRMVRWLRRIIVTPKESDSYYHYSDNRVLPSHVDAELANSEAWWYKPEYIINELNTNSVITTPFHDEVLNINGSSGHNSYTMSGYAYSGGGRKVTRVEVTFDGGETWKICDIERPEKPNKYGRYWCWCFWSLEVEVVNLIAGNGKDIAVRAWDDSLNTQQDELIWNLMGMMNNCWFRVKPKLCRSNKGQIGINFEHPTQPGNLTGGWMDKERHIELSTPAVPLKKSISSPVINTISKSFSMFEISKHASQDSAWIVVHGHVYDCTSFLKDHPGGTDSILINAGMDCTEEFDAIHSDKAKKMLEDYRIGELTTDAATTTSYTSAATTTVAAATTTTSYTSNSTTSSPNTTVQNGTHHLAPVVEAPATPVRSVALTNPREKIQCKLVEKTSISHDVRVFKFALKFEDQCLGLPVGKHIFVCSQIDGKLCMRAYTPSSDVDAVGYFDLVVKIYFKDVHPKFPNGGLMSQHLDSLAIGSIVEFKGPTGHIEYVGKGSFVVHGKMKSARKLSMLAGGTGITPMYQIIQAILKDPEDQTQMYLIYANRTEDDILLWAELDDYAKEHSHRFKVWYVIQDSVREGWKYSLGFTTEDIMRAHIPEADNETLALTCGPPPMIQFAVKPNLEKMGYDVKESLLVF